MTPVIGLLAIDKPSGLTSHDVVNEVRHLLGVRRVGHGGTLDPMATGVLIVLVGAATRLAQFVSGHDKRYAATIRLGISTTTYDAEGDVTDRRSVAVSEVAVREALTSFVGDIDQVPPMYAALKVGGRRLYDLARKGGDIERVARPVTIHSLQVVEWAPPDVRLDVTCSPGTYIRSLAHDLGVRLGCGAHLAQLRRTHSGPFGIESSYSLPQLREHVEHHTLSEVLLPPAAALHGLKIVRLDRQQETAMRHGKVLVLEPTAPANTLQALDADGWLIGVLARTQDAHWQPQIVLPPRNTESDDD